MAEQAKPKKKGKPQGPIDPTENVKELVKINMVRQDDLRTAEGRRGDDLRSATIALAVAESRRVDENLRLRADFDKELREAESRRIDAIRAVDVNAVAVASERAAQQANVLANQVAASAEALRGLVASTASTIAQQLAQITTQFTERLAAVEKAQYEGQGKSTVNDPLMNNLMVEMKAAREAGSMNAGRSALSTPLLLLVCTTVGGLLVYLIEHH